MRIVSYETDGPWRAGALTDDGVIDAAKLLSEDRLSVRELLAANRIAELAGRVEAGLRGRDRVRRRPALQGRRR